MQARGRATISAVLIVKDEEDVLESCLESVSWADEIVVYDTGSSDSTRAIAARFTDLVVEGYWDDDFGGARNRALEHATGEWVLSIDADEVFVGEPSALRARLGVGGVARHVLTVRSARPVDLGPAAESIAVRVFRRRECHWVGRLHEQVVIRPGRRTNALFASVPDVQLLHSGYRQDVVDAKDKAGRNVRLAERELAAALAAGRTDNLTVLRVNLARSFVIAGRVREALDLAEEIASCGDPAPLVVVELAGTMSWLAHVNGDHAGSERWLDRWLAATDHPAWAHARRAEFSAERGDAPAVLEAVAHVPTSTLNDFGQRLERLDLSRIESWALHTLGRHDDAVDLVLAAARSGRTPSTPEVLVATFEAAGRPLEELLPLLSAESWSGLAVLAGHSSSPSGLVLLRQMRRHRPEDVTVLTCAAAWGTRMTVEEALDWSTSIRAVGLAELCPLRALATCAERDPRERVLAAAVAFTAFTDAQALPALEGALAQVLPEHEAELAELVESVAPGLLTPSA